MVLGPSTRMGGLRLWIGSLQVLWRGLSFNDDNITCRISPWLPWHGSEPPAGKCMHDIWRVWAQTVARGHD